MIVNTTDLLKHQPIKNMLDHKASAHGVTYGMSEAGYDIRIKQDIVFMPRHGMRAEDRILVDRDWNAPQIGRFVLASAIEEFQMPTFLAAIVHDKSTWARRGLSVFNTVIEPGWNGFLTLELVYHGTSNLHIPSGSGIAQVVFHSVSNPAQYNGRYQNQEDKPVAAKEFK